MSGLTKTLVAIVILVHFMFFILEAVCWQQPFIYNILVPLLNNPVSHAVPDQAAILHHLFINQGFYNLFLVITGIYGLWLMSKRPSAGYMCLLVLCFFGIGAAFVLACSTVAYVLALIQGVPAVLAFIKIYPLFKKS